MFLGSQRRVDARFVRMERCPMTTDLFAYHVLLAMLELWVVVPYAPRLLVGKVGCSHVHKKWWFHQFVA